MDRRRGRDVRQARPLSVTARAAWGALSCAKSTSGTRSNRRTAGLTCTISFRRRCTSGGISRSTVGTQVEAVSSARLVVGEPARSMIGLRRAATRGMMRSAIMTKTLTRLLQTAFAWAVASGCGGDCPASRATPAQPARDATDAFDLSAPRFDGGCFRIGGRGASLCYTQADMDRIRDPSTSCQAACGLLYHGGAPDSLTSCAVDAARTAVSCTGHWDETGPTCSCSFIDC